MLSDPIVALATAPGRSALAVVRLSGEGALDIAGRVVDRFCPEPARQARLAAFRDGQGRLIDRGLYTVFPEPASYTGEDLVEFSCHGGLAAPTRLVAALQAAGARPAFPGEFTRRAVLNGKMDLLQAEAVGDLIDATAPAQAHAALRQMDGGLSRRLQLLRLDLIDLQALLSYDVDFPDEDDGPVSPERIASRLEDVAGQIDRLLATSAGGERLREGALLVLAGPPNAGKSSLFNALLGADRALVTELPGTTRDAIEAHTDFLGWPIRLVDTAGLGEARDRIDHLGMQMSHRYIGSADLVLLCHEAAIGAPVDAAPYGPPDRVLEIRTKSDLARPQGSGIPASAVTGEGLEAVRRAAAERVFGERMALADIEPELSRARHREALDRARLALAAVRPHLGRGGDASLAAHHVREASSALDELVGTVDVEQVLDRVFSSFCVGK
jgi:tRNA modification GTPase